MSHAEQWAPFREMMDSMIMLVFVAGGLMTLPIVFDLIEGILRMRREARQAKQAREETE